MLDRANVLGPAGIGRLIVGFGAATTSSLLVCWMPVSLLGRFIIFAGSGIIGGLLAGWAANATTPARALGKSIASGAVQANVAGGALAVIATAVDTALGIGPTEGKGLSFAFAIALATLIVGTLVGAAVGLAYGFVPAFVAASRVGRTHASTDRLLVAAATWLSGVGLAHRFLVEGSTIGLRGETIAPIDHALLTATWAAPIAIALVLVGVAFFRAWTRHAFVRRVREGREPRYRVVEVEAAAVGEESLPLVAGVTREQCRFAVVPADDEAIEVGYREAAAPPPSLRAIALLP